MSVQTQIDRISGAVSAAFAALSEKGVEVPDGTKVDGLAALIAAIEAGGGGSGGAIVTTGTITGSEDIYINNHVLQHELGRKPLVLALWFDGTSGSANNQCRFYLAYRTSIDEKFTTSIFYGATNLGKTTGSINANYITENNITLSSNRVQVHLPSGSKYIWFAAG